MSQTPSLSKTILDAIEGRLLGLHTMLPGKVVKVDVAKGKCDVQPLIMRLRADGTSVPLPIIANCPIGFYRAGTAAVYLPLAVGHNVEIRFCERSLDTWLTKGGTVDPEDARKHNLSDAVVYPGLYDFTQPPADADPADLVIVNESAKINLTAAGKFKFQGATDELLATLATLVDDLINALQLDPLTGPGPAFDTGTITNLQTVKTKLQGLTK